MRTSIKIGRLFGINILLHWSFFLIVFIVIFNNWQDIGNPIIILRELGFVLAIFCCVVLHELGHALAARGYGIQTRQIILLPIGGVAQLESIPEKPSKELWVAIAGPLVNVGIAAILLPIALFLYPLSSFEDLKFFEDNFLARLILTNIILVVFNLIPAFPMDGGRILRALLTFKFGHLKATNIAARIGQIFALGFIYLGILYNQVWIFTGLFIILSAEQERRMVTRRHVVEEGL